jgi:O-antigen/teichoic acid export membrane protein
MLLRLTKNALSLIVFVLGDKLIYVYLFAIIARTIPKDDLGLYSLVLAMIMLGEIIATLGVDYVLVRDISKNRSHASKSMMNAGVVTLCSSLVAWIIVPLLAYFFGYSEQTQVFLRLTGIIYLFISANAVLSAVIKAFERMEVFALISFSQSIIGFGLSVLVLYLGFDFQALLLVMIISEILKTFFLAFVVHKYFAPFTFEFDKKVILTTAKNAIPFALFMTYGVLLKKTDIIFLGWLGALEDVALYSVSVKFTDFLAIISSSFITALFPAITSKMVANRDDSWRLYISSISVFVMLGSGVFFSVVVLAKPILIFLFGDTFIASSFVLKMLCLSFFFNVITGPTGVVLFASGDKMYKMVSMCFVVLTCNICLNLWFIPLYGYNGAAIATCISSFIGSLGRIYLSVSYFNKVPNLFKITWRIFIAGLGMMGVLYLLQFLPLFVLVGIGLCVFVFILIILGEFKNDQYKELTEKIPIKYRKLMNV